MPLEKGDGYATQNFTILNKMAFSLLKKEKLSK